MYTIRESEAQRPWYVISGRPLLVESGYQVLAVLFKRHGGLPQHLRDSFRDMGSSPGTTMVGPVLAVDCCAHTHRAVTGHIPGIPVVKM